MAQKAQDKIILDLIKVGDKKEICKIMQLRDVEAFAAISEDRNPLHLDEQFAAQSHFGAQIIHGLMAASLFSGLFGTKLPGSGCVYRRQALKFTRPIFLDEEVLARIEVTGVNKKLKTISFETTCIVDGKVAIAGTAEIFCPNAE